MPVPVALSPVAIQQFFDVDGNPLAGGQLFTFAAGTSTPLGTFTDSTGSVLNSNPIILDAGGFANIWLQALAYKFILQDADGVTQWTVDGILGTGGTNQKSPFSQIFTGTGTFTIPSGITSLKVSVVGGGGGGGGGTVANSGGGGGSGGVAIKWLTGLTPGLTLAVAIGAIGTGNSGATGTNGNAAQVASGTQTITTVVANGGGGGITGAVPGGGLPATVGTGGDVNLGGGAGTTGQPAINVGGTGGSSFFGGGGAAGGPNTAGAIALASGGGGGGAGGSVGNTAGGNGAAGIVIFEWII